MKDRIIKLIDSENLTSAKFAEEIGVQPSSISHIIAGRNNPSFDFIIKILKRFPKINAEWLLLGKGQMFKSIRQTSIFEILPDENQKNELSSSNVDKIFPVNSLHGNSDDFNKKDNLDIEIEKIVIFYSNKTFKDYLPSQ